NFWRAAKDELGQVAPQPAAPVVKESLTVAEPVKVPSDKLINDLAREAYSYAVGLDAATRNADSDEIEGVAKAVTTQLKDKLRALLASYVQPAQPAASAEPVELQGIVEALGNGDGLWRSCSGCHELNGGHDTGPYS